MDAYYKEVLDRGANITVAPGDRPYGIREFNVHDPNGISIIFGQDIEAEQAAQTDRA